MTDLEISQRMVRTAHSARSRDIEFNMSFEYMKELLNTKICFITGTLLQMEDDSLDDYLTLERLDNSVGYTDDNVVACRSYINKKKGDLSVKEVEMIYKAMQKKGLL